LNVLDQSEVDSIQNLYAYYTPTIAHVFSLISYPTPTFPPTNISLLIVDDISTLFPPPYRKGPNNKTQATPKPSSQSAQSALVTALTRFASTHNVAVVVLSQVITRIRHNESGISGRAFLIPAQDAKEWDAGFASRVGIFRDFVPISAWNVKRDGVAEDLEQRFRYAGLIKANGRNGMDQDGYQGIVPFGLSSASLSLILMIY
jgi:hypothetical protein